MSTVTDLVASGFARTSIRRVRRTVLMAAATVAMAAGLWSLGTTAAWAQPTTTPTTAPTTTAPTTTAPTTTTTAPTTTTTTLPPTTTTHPTTTTSTSTTTTTTTTTIPHHHHPSTAVAAWVWLVIGLAVLAAIGTVIALLVRRRRQAAALAWTNQTKTTVDEIDRLALSVGSADQAALGALSAREAPRLANLVAQLREHEARAPDGPRRDELVRLISASDGLQTTLMSAQLPGAQRQSDIRQWAAQVNSAAATARAGLRRPKG